MASSHTTTNFRKQIAICILIAYSCLFFVPNPALHSCLHNYDGSNSVIAKIFNAPECLFSLPPRIGITSHSLCKFTKVIFFKEATIVYALSILFFCLMAPIEYVSFYLTRIVFSYSLAPPTA